MTLVNNSFPNMCFKWYLFICYRGWISKIPIKVFFKCTRNNNHNVQSHITYNADAHKHKWKLMLTQHINIIICLRTIRLKNIKLHTNFFFISRHNLFKDIYCKNGLIVSITESMNVIKPGILKLFPASTRYIAVTMIINVENTCIKNE